jgi:biopolymer transport protein TolR
MSRRRSRTHSEPITKVNVTPIIDVALVLVIILLVTAPMLTVADLPVDLPAAHTRDAEDERNVSITLGQNGEVAIDRDVISLDDLHRVLAARLAEPGNGDVLVVVRADAGATHADVRHLLAEARAAGATRIAIATRQKAEEGVR